jgi:hypothetical protein
MAEKRDGLVYVSKQDILFGTALQVGDVVTFYLYVDGQGLGAEGCNVEQAAVSQPSNEPAMVYYVPVAYMVTEMPLTGQEAITSNDGACPHKNYSGENPRAQLAPAKTDPTQGNEALPSVGSAGHFEGTCKRCAFFPKGRCLNGADCTHCHFDHVPRRRMRNRKATLSTEERPVDGEEDAEIAPDEAGDEASLECCETAASTAESTTSEVQLDTNDTETQDELSTGDLLEACNSSESEESDSSGNLDVWKEACKLPESVPSDADAETETPSPSVNGMSDDEEASHHGSTTSPTSWSELQRIRKAAKLGAPSETPPAEVARMARSLLNKLTEEKFEPISGQIFALPLHTKEQLAAVTAEIFGKATMERGFRSLYVELCKQLDGHLTEQSGAIGGKVFRKALVNECQIVFERSLEPQDPTLFEGMTCDERFESETILKTRRLGNMRFIGELMVCRLLAPKLMLPIVHELLEGDETALEALIAFLSVIGPAFEQERSPYQAPLKDVFTTLRRKKSDKKISPRMRFLMSDLFEVRAKGSASQVA